MIKGNAFELYFQGLVKDFGGTLLPEADSQVGAKTADFYFEQYGIIAELKTLTEDSSAKMNAVLIDAVLTWGDPQSIPVKRDANNFPYVEPESIPEVIQKKWMDKLFQEVERNVSSANKQIADTKARFDLSNARGVLLVANESNQYHNNPESYREALGRLVDKRTANGERRYAQIDGGVYFSKKLPARLDQMPFWAPFHIEEPTNTNAKLQAFLLELRARWYAYIEKTTGITVRQHNVDRSLEN